MAVKDTSWKVCYAATAGQLSATQGGSSGTRSWIFTKHAIGVEFMISALNMTAASAIRLGIAERDDSSSTVVTKKAGSDGNLVYVEMTATGRSTPAITTNSYETCAEPWLDGADASATITVKYRRIYPDSRA